MHLNIFEAKKLKIAIIQAKFYPEITDALKIASVEKLVEYGINRDEIQIFIVPGTFEISLAAKKAAQSGSFDAVICLGAVIKGDILNFDYISQAVTAGIIQATLETEIPILYGIIVASTLELASKYTQPDELNKGYEAANAAIEMIKICEVLDEI